MQTQTKSAFTLIELLIVIVIIGILAGVVLAVINPALLIARSNQGSARAVVAKACLAYNGCMAATNSTVAMCNTAVLSGIQFPTTNTYGGAFSVNASGVPLWTATAGGCILTCNTTGTASVDVNASCLIAQQ